MDEQRDTALTVDEHREHHTDCSPGRAARTAQGLRSRPGRRRGGHGVVGKKDSARIAQVSRLDVGRAGWRADYYMEQAAG